MIRGRILSGRREFSHSAGLPYEVFFAQSFVKLGPGNYLPSFYLFQRFTNVGGVLNIECIW